MLDPSRPPPTRGPFELDPTKVPTSVGALAAQLESAGYEAWLVGGAVRDALLGLPVTDHDIATNATPDQVQQLFTRTVPTGIDHGTVTVLGFDAPIEVTTFRKDVATDGRHATVEYTTNIREDLARRDFTINAMAYRPTTGALADPFNGRIDLTIGRIKAVGDPEQRFMEDYLRILRMVRFSHRLDFFVDTPTWAAAESLARHTEHLSVERVLQEWYKSLATAQDPTGLVQTWGDLELDKLHLGSHVCSRPRPPQEERDPVLMTAYYLPNPPGPDEALRRLKASKADLNRVTRVRDWERMWLEANPKFIRRWLSEAGVDAVLDTLTLWRWQKPNDEHHARVREAYNQVITDRDPFEQRHLAIKGDELMAMGIHGRAVGETLRFLLACVLEEPKLNRSQNLQLLAQGYQVKNL